MIAPGIEEMLEPLERFEDIRRRAVRLGPRLCDLAYANPYRGVQEAARAAIRAALEDERTLDLQYTPFGGHSGARRAVADSLREGHGLDVGFADVVLTPGAMAALHLALRTCARPGGEVIVPVPCWIDHPMYVRAVGLTAILVPLPADGFDLDVEALRAAITERTCAVLLSHPANPTGRSYRPEALSGLGAAIAEAEDRFGTQITLIADETHRDFTGSRPFEAAAAFVDRTLIVYSFGKYHFLQGQRIGYVAVAPSHPEREAAARELVRWTRILGVATPTALMQRALPDLIRLRHDQTWLDAWRRRYVDELSEFGYTVVRPDATLFVYAGVPGDREDFEFIDELAMAGVLALPSPIFHHTGYFRLALTGSEEMLERALPILRKAA